MINTKFQTIEDIKKISIPASAETMKGYQVIPHMDVINNIKEELGKKGIGITKENYKVAKFGNQIYGNIVTDLKSDSDLGGALHFVNSYDKSKKLEIISGAIVFICGNGMIKMVDISASKRKHVGSIATIMKHMIYNSICNLEKEYELLVEAKKRFQEVEVSKRLQSELAGRLFMEEKLLTPTQMPAFRRECEKVDSPFGDNTAWKFYNNCTEVLKLSHPSNYLNDHIKLHKFALEVF